VASNMLKLYRSNAFGMNQLISQGCRITELVEKNGNTRSKSILIVDDDKVILDVLARGFKHHGLKVFQAENAVDGLNLFLKECPDIVLTDIRMPGDFDGAELARRIREQSPGTTIAVITGGDGEIGGILLKNGIADYFFTKPCSINHICKTLIANKA
jgi:DNA-binding response OmpR family regulator